MCSISWSSWRCRARSMAGPGSVCGAVASSSRLGRSRTSTGGCIWCNKKGSRGSLFCVLHIGVVRPAGAFRGHPVDVLGGVLDVTGFAMYAVLRVDLELLLAIFLGDDFVNAGRAVALRRFVVHRQVLAQRNARIGELQVAGLFLFMVGVGEEYRAELVEAEFAVGLRVADLLRVCCRLQAGVIRLGVVQGEGDLAAEDVLVEPVEAAANQRAELVQRWAEVAAAEQLVVQPAGLECVDVAGQLVAAFLACKQRVSHGVSSEHAGLHGGVAALDLGEVQGAEVATDQCTAVEDHLRQRVEAAFADGAGTVRNALAAFQVLGDHRVVLVALELIERRQMRVAVRQVDDQTDYHLVVFQVIEEGAAGVFASNDIQWPAGGVYHQALLVLGWVDIPDFLDADAVMLSIGFGVEVEFVDQCFLSGEARVDFYAEVFRLLRQPAAQVAQGNDVVAMVVHGLGYEEVRNLGGLLGIAEHVDVIALDRSVQRGAELFPVWEQFIQCARLEHRAGKNVCADFGAFFDHADADFFAGFGGFLLQSAGGGQTSRAGADDDDVEFHKFAFHMQSPTQGSLILFGDRARSMSDAGALYPDPSGGPIQTFV